MKPPKIVLLTDFSPLSRVAIQFALKLAGPLQAEFTILNVIRIEGPSKANMKLKQIEKMLVVAAEEEGKALIKELKAEVKGDYTLKFKAVQDHTVAAAITSYTSRNPTNMVVMGSRGASALKKVRMGGTTVSVIDDCDVPVLAIPEKATFRNLQKIVYASDLKNVQKELDMIVEFAAIYGSHVHVIHVVPALDKKTENAGKVMEDMIKKSKYAKIDFRIIIDEDITSAIDGFIKSTKSDLLTTFTHHLSLYEKLFARSVTRTLAYLGTIPLLAIKHRQP
ncbi:MAG: universal stress protein [Cyclobacteriaceae bacterium]|nr:universal stress protein [Cyclobacteriaceae bacterium]